MKKHTILFTAVAVALVGCATAPPNTPGAGSGATYTPFVDLQGVDPARYSSDLAACRSYAQQIDPEKASMQGMVAGVLVGALVGAAVGGNRNSAQYGAGYGGTVGVVSGGGRAVLKQETVIANCLAGRGYRVLEGATVGTNTSVPSPYTYAAATSPQPVGGSATNISPVVQTGGTQSAPVQVQRTGQDSLTVEKLVKTTACNPQPNALLAVKGPGFETYTVSCVNGDSWMYRCEFGNCRKLQ